MSKSLPYLRAFRSAAVFVVVLAVLGAALGLAGAAARPATETSTAVTSITSADLGLTVDSTYSVNQMIRVTMATYVAFGESTEVVESAAAAAGTDAATVAGGLSITREPDANVLSWELTTPAGTDALAGLRAALSAFERVLATSGPKSKDGYSLVITVVNSAPDRSVDSGIPLGLGALLGALAGIVAAAALVLTRVWRARHLGPAPEAETTPAGVAEPPGAEGER